MPSCPQFIWLEYFNLLCLLFCFLWNIAFLYKKFINIFVKSDCFSILHRFLKNCSKYFCIFSLFSLFLLLHCPNIDHCNAPTLNSLLLFCRRRGRWGFECGTDRRDEGVGTSAVQDDEARQGAGQSWRSGGRKRKEEKGEEGGVNVLLICLLFFYLFFWFFLIKANKIL